MSEGKLWLALYGNHTLIQQDYKTNVIIAARTKDHALETLHAGLDCRLIYRLWQVYYQGRKLDYATKEDEAGVIQTRPVMIMALTRDQAVRLFLNRIELTETVN